MRRRTFVALLGGAAAFLGGCLSGTNDADPDSETPTSTGTADEPRGRTRSQAATRSRTATGSPKPTDTSAPVPSGSVDNHRTTAVEAVSHDAVQRTTDDGREWVVTVTLSLIPQDPETITVFPIGMFVYFFDEDDRELARVYETVPANTGDTPRTVTRSVPFDPSDPSVDSFARYRIDLVHG